MTIENKFNLADEPWIPVTGKGLVSLLNIFSDPSLPALGGNPIQKIALTKLLLAIAQSAYTPKDDEDWKNLGASGMAKKALAYLTANKNLFWLYGEKPFLQMPAIAETEKFSFGKLMPSIATGNTTILNHSQVEHSLSDSEKALLIMQLMGFALGGKQVDNSTPLSSGYMGNKNLKGKDASGRAGRFSGYAHSFIVTDSLHETIFCNLLTTDDISKMAYFQYGVGDAPWRKMPTGEVCSTAKHLKDSYIGCLVPLCRYVLLAEDKIHNADGILYDRGSKTPPKRPLDPSLSFDPMLTVDRSKTAIRISLVNPDKKPWRELLAMLSFISNTTTQKECVLLSMCVPRIKQVRQRFSIWSGGLSFSSKAGEHAPRGADDFVESETQLNSVSLGDIWFAHLKQEMSELEDVARKLKFSVYKANKREIKESREKDKRADSVSKEAETLFWQLCERKFQELVNACDDDSGKDVKKLRVVFARSVVNKAYDTYCPKDTARQLDAWAKNRPNLEKYLG